MELAWNLEAHLPLHPMKKNVGDKSLQIKIIFLKNTEASPNFPH